MKSIYKISYPAFKAFAFSLDPEMAHELTINLMKNIGNFLPDDNSNCFELNAMGLNFKNPIGLAAGLDKNAEIIPYMTHLPFGFVEVGTVTPKAQLGNDKPRLFRYPEEESLRNRMGFNNHGAISVLDNLKNANRRGKIVGVNLGKNKATSNEEAVKDYSYLYEVFAPHADYLVVNVSSPNTPGLRDLLKDKGLRDIFEGLIEKRKLSKKALLIKVSPDMRQEELASVVALAREYSLDGIVATNTTVIPERGEGGFSGKILSSKSRETRDFLLKEIARTHIADKNLELIGVGGFSQIQDCLDFWKSGGRLIQIYSAFIFQGPQFLYEINDFLKIEIKKSGVRNFEEYLNLLHSKIFY